MGNGMSDPITQEQYNQQFDNDNEKRKQALEKALDSRKFEIDLYWKRAAYFWAFIAATFAAYGAIQLSSSADKPDLSVVLSCLGVVFSFGWFCVNKGSKQWQENWENHVYMLEDDFIGPLYKTMLERPEPETGRERLWEFITGPGPLSVSKINLVISLFITLLWILLLCRELITSLFVEGPINVRYTVTNTLVVILTFIACATIFVKGKTYKGSHWHIARTRTTKIVNSNKNTT